MGLARRWLKKRLERVLKPLVLSLYQEATSKTDASGHPNINPIWLDAKDFATVRNNVKTLGYRLARDMAARLPPPSGTSPHALGLSCRPSRQAEIEAEWFAHWCEALHLPRIYHRKLWEYAFLLQTLHDADMLQPGRRGLGFGCGEEPIPSYLASRGVTVTATDLDPAAVSGLGWAETGQHADTLDHLFEAHLVDRGTFARHVSLRHVDMMDIPADLGGYDFCWSICALEHLGSIARGLAFIEASLATLKPGGVAVHTTEFAYSSTGRTIDNWMTVLFLRGHFEALAQRLTAAGHWVAPLDFDAGTGLLDQFVDLPPYEELGKFPERGAAPERYVSAPLKLAIDGIASTCFGLVIRRG